MPDICMCRGDGCDVRDACYRFRATPNEFRQSYFAKPPIAIDGRCYYRLPLMAGDPVLTRAEEAK